MKTLSIVWQRLVNDQGKTCPRCQGTGDAVRHAVERLDSVLPEADYLLLTCPLTPQTRGLISRQRLALMKPTAGLINMARGAVVVADLHLEPAQAVANEIGGLAVRCDVSKEADIQALVATTRERYGRVDAYISNAGILGRPGGIELEDPLWDAMWNIHGMAHVWAARAVVPEMVERGEGGFGSTGRK